MTSVSANSNAAQVGGTPYPFDAVAPARPLAALNDRRTPSDRYLAYRIAVATGRHIMSMCLRLTVIRREAPERPGPYILALTHLSHLDPFLCSILVRRKVDFIASVGFYRFGWAARFMQLMQSIAINRHGVPVSAFRKAIAHLRQGRVVGICPEGGVAQGANSAMKGARIKRGVCLLAQRTGLPVLPAVMLGTDKLNCVWPWIPPRRGRLYVAFGHPIEWPAGQGDRRAAREVLAGRIEQAYRDLYRELLQRCEVDESFVP